MTDAPAMRLRAATVSLWFGKSTAPQLPPIRPGSVVDFDTAVGDPQLAALLAAARTLPRTGPALRFALHFTVVRAFEDGQLACHGCVEFATLGALVTWAREMTLAPADAAVQSQGRELPTWRFLVGKRRKAWARWKHADEVDEDEGGGTHRVSVR